MRAFVMAVALSAAAGSTAPARAQAPLSVPYLPQTEALCGGAAAAMVMRFWGARGVYADAFAPLVDASAGGIRTSALSGALVARGWRADAGGGDLSRLTQEIGRGRPVIALIEDRPGRYHYVVVVAASDAGVVVHDPARGPSRAIDLVTFDRRWQKSDRWMLVVLPGREEMPPKTAITDGVEEGRSDPGAGGCQGGVEEGIGLAQRGERDAARRVLQAAALQCPGSGAPWREIAGLDALDGRWDDAATHARRAVERDPDDAHAWRILATAAYLRHDDLGALAAWNRVGEPRVDLVDIKGLTRTRYRAVADAIGAQPRDLLTPAALRTAQRRVRDIPAVATARLTFHPLDRGEVQVDATIVERERAPRAYPSWLAIGAGAVANAEVAASFANVSGGGDAVDLSWRWWARRPRIAASYAAPGPGGIWRLEASRETQTFGAPAFEQTRSRAGAEVGNWITERVRLSAGLALDRWSGIGRTAAVSGRAHLWPVIDRVAVDGGLTGWLGSHDRFAAADARVRWRSTPASTGTIVLANAGYQLATASAPAFAWPGADTGHARDVLLRAHPLLDGGVIAGGVFGRRIGFAGIEAQHWLAATHPLLRIAPAVFVDTARAARGLSTSDRRLHVDAGAGVRLSLLGLGVLRVDVGRGLRDGRTALSVGWQR